MSTSLKFIISFHAETDGQLKHIIQTLKDMLRACVLDFQGSWDQHLPLVEFAYNNSYQSSFGIAPYETLYGRRCRTPVYWSEVGEWKLLSPKIVQATTDKIGVIKERLKVAQCRQKSHVDKKYRDVEFDVEDKVFIRILPWKGVMRFVKKGKLSLHYIGPYKIVK